MRNRTLVFVVVIFAFAMSLSAAGRKDNESHEVDNPSGFTESINLEGKKTGKYNFYLEAKDKGGNTAIAGPDNIYIDPESDLPVASITNPRDNMHVQGNLNIVGTCVDDDGVGSVELVITRGADGKGEELVRTPAKGAEFWSYFLDTSDNVKWPDGVYSITAWGVDINGLSGVSEDFKPKQHKIHQVYWNLDRKKPETKVTSHDLGSLVSGKIQIKGTVQDGNGVNGLEYSTDGGKVYKAVKPKYDKKNDIYNFEISVDTRTIQDGPSVLWFRAWDGMGTLGAASHLVFVDNTGPDVGIVYPAEDAVVNGIFTVAGFAQDTVGLERLSWKMGRETGDFPLTIGNPYWIKEFDIRGQKTSSADLEIHALDLSGNLTVSKRKIKVDQNADLPRVTLQEPVLGAVIPAKGMNLAGSASDDDGVASVLYSIDGQEPVEIACSGYFQQVITDIPPGTHTLDVWARDITGIEGPKTQIKNIAAPGLVPEPRILTVRSGSGKTLVQNDFYTGIVITPAPKMLMDFAVSAGSPLKSASVQFGDGPALPVNVKAAKDGSYHADVAVPLDLAPGLVKLELKATDRYGQEGVWQDFAYFTAADGTTGGSRTFQWVRPDESLGDGRILITQTGEPLIGLSGGQLLQSASVSGSGSENISATVDDFGRVNLSVRGEGSFGPVTLSLTDISGGSFSSSPFTILADLEDPSFRLTENMEDQWVQTKVPVKFTAGDANKINAVEFSINLGVSWQNLLQRDELSQVVAGQELERTLDISSLPDGAVNVSLRVSDEANRAAVRSFTILKDTQAPQPQLIVPISGARVNGTVRMGIAISEGGKLTGIDYEKPAGGTEEAPVPAISKTLYPDPAAADSGNPMTFLDVLLDSTVMPLAENMSFTFTDASGNSSRLNIWPFIIDQQMDIPVAQISLPLDNEVITTDFVVSGIMYDDDAIKQIYWHIDDNPDEIVEAANGYSVSIPLSSMTDNEHSVTVVAEDIYGVKSAPVTRNFRVSLEEPKASVALPTFEEIVKGTVRLSGVASDKNDISRIQVSLDNGNSYNDAYGTTEWAYQFNSKILKDGTHVVFVRVWDGYNITALYSSLINIDNTPPEVVLDSPLDGLLTTGPIHITGRAIDLIQLEDITIEIRSLEGKIVPEELAIRNAAPGSILMESADLSTLEDGIYNIEVWAIDKAENITRVSRNVELIKDSQRNFVDNLYPLEGEHVQGTFNLYGYVGGIDKASSVTLAINDVDVTTEAVTDAGFYRFSLSGENLRDGLNKLVVHSDFGGKETVLSDPRNIYYQASGAWVTVDSLNMGDFAFERPWLLGRGGYTLNADDQAALEDKKTDKSITEAIKFKALDYIDISFDNGKTFFMADKARDKDADWRYRLETGEMIEGMHYLVIRANMKNGETAITRTLVQVDKTPPVIRLITPEAGGRYNQSLEYTALASDDVELSGLSYYLRKGDKAAYAVPGFLQGLYLEATIPPFIKQVWNDAPSIFAGGATYMDVGMGLSFFDDNVKVQVQYGFMTQDIYESMGETQPVRYGGHVLGLKLLANLYTLPFGSFMGPDWDWLSASFALGANFSLFDVAGEGYTQSGSRTWLSALIGQIEFPKVTIPKRKFLRTFSFFTEGQLWFVPTDVDADSQGIKTVIPHIILGLRVYLF